MGKEAGGTAEEGFFDRFREVQGSSGKVKEEQGSTIDLQ